MAKKIWEYSLGYRLARPYTDFITRTCFRSVSLEGLERIPKGASVLLAPNHCAALMDPMIALLLDKGPVGFGARSDIFAKPMIARILRWLRILPIARERNGRQEVAKNFEIFDEIVDCLAHEVPFCLYSEGTHRAERGMLPVKKGIFRIAKMAADQLDRPVFIVPIGVNYEYFFRGQGRMRVRVGEPLEIRETFLREAERPEAEIYRGLCKELRERDLALIGEPMTRRHDRIALRLAGALLSLPLFAVCAVGALPIWLPFQIILHGMEDKAWAHSVRYVLHFLLPLFIPFNMGLERLLNVYRNLSEDLKK